MDVKMYLLLTEDQELIAKGVLKGVSNVDGTIQLSITEGIAEFGDEFETFKLIGSEADEPPIQCQLVRQNGDMIVLKKLKPLNIELRKSFRVPFEFESFAYPISGSWKGRKPLHLLNLSCGGIAFHSASVLEIGEIAEVVIPKSYCPVIVQMKILRRDQMENEQMSYAASFVNMCPDEEQAVCQAVFSVQMKK